MGMGIYHAVLFGLPDAKKILAKCKSPDGDESEVIDQCSLQTTYECNSQYLGARLIDGRCQDGGGFPGSAVPLVDFAAAVEKLIGQKDLMAAKAQWAEAQAAFKSAHDVELPDGVLFFVQDYD